MNALRSRLGGAIRRIERSRALDAPVAAVDPIVSRLTQDDRVKRVLGVRSRDADLHPAAMRANQGHQVKDALPIDRRPAFRNPNIRLKPAGYLHNLRGNASMNTEPVRDDKFLFQDGHLFQWSKPESLPMLKPRRLLAYGIL